MAGLFLPLVFEGGQVNKPVRAFERLAEICERLSGVAASQLSRRLSFMAYELAARLPPKCNITHLAEYLFEDQGFKSADDALADIDEIVLSDVLQKRVGVPMALGLVLKSLAEKSGLDARFIKFPGFSILKSKDEHGTQYLDLKKRGKILTRDEILELLHEEALLQKRSEQISFECLEDEEIISNYLSRLGLEYQDRRDDPKSLVIYEALLSLQPKNLSVLRDRSLAYYRLNRFGDALQDLKRFFSFSNPEQQPRELLELYDDLQKKMEFPTS
jgi:regulator of sirC expression with transglutaminase-like and TPR domain